MTSLYLTYVPVLYSEHFYINGVEQERTDWTFEATYNRITPGSGVATVSGDRLECRYAHLGELAPPPPDATFPATASIGEDTTGTHTITYASPPGAGHSIMLAYRPKFGGAISSVSGLGATWTHLITYNAQEIWCGTNCNGSGSAITVVSDHCMNIDTVEVDQTLDASGAVTDSGASTHVESVVAPDYGIAYAVHWGGAGIGHVPSSGWYAIPKGNPGQGSTTFIISADPGSTYDIHTNGINAFQSAAVVAVPYA